MEDKLPPTTKLNFHPIAERVPKGDNWRLFGFDKLVKSPILHSEVPIYNSLTEVLEAYFTFTHWKGSYKLDPLGSMLYIIEETNTKEVVVEEKHYGIYGEFHQGK